MREKREIALLREELARLRARRAVLCRRVGFEGVGYDHEKVVVQCNNCGTQIKVERADFMAGKFDVPDCHGTGATWEDPT